MDLEIKFPSSNMPDLDVSFFIRLEPVYQAWENEAKGLSDTCDRMRDEVVMELVMND